MTLLASCWPSSRAKGMLRLRRDKCLSLQSNVIISFDTLFGFLTFFSGSVWTKSQFLLSMSIDDPLFFS